MNLFKKIAQLFRKSPEEVVVDQPEAARPHFLTHMKAFGAVDRRELLRRIDKLHERKMTPVNEQGVELTGVAMDGCNQAASLASSMSLQAAVISDAALGWYASQSFIGYQTCAIIAQNWLVNKACEVPARDAVAPGYDITINEGDQEVNNEIIQKMIELDKLYKIDDNLREYVQFGRVFGIRIAMFRFDFASKDEEREFYAAPFNMDGVRPKSYKGISQIDPYWLAPELDGVSMSDPSSINFYNPTWWRLSNGMRVHRSHLMIFRTGEVADILKPVYYYGGVSIPQQIFERVYASERTANEAPQLAMSKRTTVWKMDTSQLAANPEAVESNLNDWVRFRDNYGIKVGDTQEDEFQQFDTSLADLDAVIMTQFQLVAAIANVPATELLGTSPKGFNATGEHEAKSYNKMLASIQENDLTPLLERHYMIMMKSDIEPEFKVKPDITINWNPLDAPTAKEIAEINNIKAQTATLYQGAGALGGDDIRNSVITDPDSGYNGVTEEEDDLLDDLLGEIDGDQEGETNQE